MKFTSNQQSESTPALGWWAVLVVLALGVPQCSLLLSKSLRLFSLSSSLNEAVETMIIFALFGTSNALQMTSSMVILACIMLLGGYQDRPGTRSGLCVCVCSIGLARYGNHNATESSIRGRTTGDLSGRNRHCGCNRLLYEAIGLSLGNLLDDRRGTVGNLIGR